MRPTPDNPKEYVEYHLGDRKEEFIKDYLEEKIPITGLHNKYGLTITPYYSIVKILKLPKRKSLRHSFLDSSYFDKKSYDLVVKLTKERNLKTSSLNGNLSAAKKYCTFCKKTLPELIKEAKKEQEKGVDPQKSKLKDRLIGFRDYLINVKKYCSGTVKTNYMKVKTIYVHFDITLPNLPNLKLDKPYLSSYNDLPRRNHIQIALDCSDLFFQTWIEIQISTGMAKAEARSLKYKHYFESIQDYCSIPISSDKKVLKSILNEIKHKLNNNEIIVPTFYLKRLKTDKYYYTYCTPEACEYLNQLVEKSIDKFKNMDKFLETPIFNVADSLIVTHFQKVNDLNKWGYKGKYRFFRSHVLRKYNASNLPLSSEDIDNIQGRSRSTVHEAYIKIKPEELKKRYMQKMHYVCISERWRNICKTLDNELPAEVVDVPVKESNFKQECSVNVCNNLIEGADALFKYAKLCEKEFITFTEFNKIKDLIIGEYV